MHPRYLTNLWFLLFIIPDCGVEASGTARVSDVYRSDCCSNVLSGESDNRRLRERVCVAVVSNREERMFPSVGRMMSEVEYLPVATSEYAESTEKVFQHPDIKRWIDNPDYIFTRIEAYKVIATLTEEIGDSALYYILDTASKAHAILPEEHTRVLVAEELKLQQVAYWNKVNRDPETVFKAYGLAEKKERIYSGLEFGDWLIYVSI
ncbi:hypothetical protein PsorP6_011990 [Peronosclerospora sorghi]|uniref:Uncharacterized protein n=1 Tax=Peronosclerospora sorghi TaxID=230839 RepID=A0ACC0WJI6_9STRA|nr:hypothetical protein PsorP6_011990 [Peronosclerospora sorghi]